MRRAWTLGWLVALTLAGCIAPAGTHGDGTGSTGNAGSGDAIIDGRVQAPWWPVGAYWDVEISRSGGPAQRVRLANFWNDSTTNHFWLGVPDRAVALDHALHDTNPLIGRIHWGILTPHEKGIHAAGMFNFPIEPGDHFGGLMFDREWQIQARAGQEPGSLVMGGTASDGSSISYDYDPDLMWFSFIDLKSSGGAPILRVDIVGHGTDAKGQFYFLRGRDYYEGPKSQGTREERFEVKEEETAHESLAVEIKGTVSGPLRLDLIDPKGETRHSETLTGGRIDKVFEIPDPALGTWRVRYVGTGEFDGRIAAIGILEYSGAP